MNILKKSKKSMTFSQNRCTFSQRSEKENVCIQILNSDLYFILFDFIYLFLQGWQDEAFLTVDIHLAVFGVLDMVLLGHDDVLDVLHGQVVAEGVVQQTLQFLHGQFLHVTLSTPKPQTTDLSPFERTFHE